MDLPPESPAERVDPRHLVCWPVRINYGDDTSESPPLYQGKIRDISNKGAYIWAPLDTRVGEHLHIEWDLLPEGPGKVGLRLRCDAEVVRKEAPQHGSTNFGIGVRILGYEPPQIIPACPGGDPRAEV